MENLCWRLLSIIVYIYICHLKCFCSSILLIVVRNDNDKVMVFVQVVTIVSVRGVI